MKPLSIPDEIEAYAAYLNAPRSSPIFDDEHETRMFEQDKAKARAMMWLAWLEANPGLEIE